jgi:hypothetical protein
MMTASPEAGTAPPTHEVVALQLPVTALLVIVAAIAVDTVPRSTNTVSRTIREGDICILCFKENS